MGPRGMRMGSVEGCTMSNLMVCTTVRVNKSRKLRWAGHVVRMEEGRSAFKWESDIISLHTPNTCNIFSWKLISLCLWHFLFSLLVRMHKDFYLIATSFCIA